MSKPVPEGPDSGPNRGLDPGTERQVDTGSSSTGPEGFGQGASRAAEAGGDGGNDVGPAGRSGAGTDTGDLGRGDVGHDADRDARPDARTGAVVGPPATRATTYDRQAVVARQKEQFGGLKFGATFFGWLAAAGAGVLLAALLASIGAGIGMNAGVDPNQVTGNAGTVGIISAIALLLVVLVAYFCGGYVAGRMARFNGVKQGLGVWLWGIIAAVVIAILAAITGNQQTASRYLEAAPQIPLSASSLTTGGILTAVAVVVVALIGAILGGLAGMRFHRRVDRVADDI